MKIIRTIVFTIASLFSLGCYTLKFYVNKELVLRRGDIIPWSILFIVVSFTLLVGVINLHKLCKAEKQYKELTDLVINMLEKQSDMSERQDDMSEKQDDICDELLDTIRNTRFAVIEKNKGE